MARLAKVVDTAHAKRPLPRDSGSEVDVELRYAARRFARLSKRHRSAGQLHRIDELNLPVLTQVAAEPDAYGVPSLEWNDHAHQRELGRIDLTLSHDAVYLAILG